MGVGHANYPSWIVGAARAWWASKRPAGWTVERHLRNPTIGCVGEAEATLAEYVAKFVGTLPVTERGGL